MPLIGTRGAASARGFGMFGKVAYPLIGGGNWVGMEGTVTGGTAGYTTGVKIDSAGNVIVVGLIQTGNGEVVIAKYNSSGTLQWQRSFTGSGATFYPARCTTDASNNIYVVGSIYSSSLAAFFGFVLCLTSSGTLSFQKYIDLTAGGYEASFTGVAIGSSGDIYISGYTRYTATGARQALVVRLNSTATSILNTCGWGPTTAGSTLELLDIGIYGSGLVVTGYGPDQANPSSPSYYYMVSTSLTAALSISSSNLILSGTYPSSLVSMYGWGLWADPAGSYAWLVGNDGNGYPVIVRVGSGGPVAAVGNLTARFNDAISYTAGLGVLVSGYSGGANGPLRILACDYFLTSTTWSRNYTTTGSSVSPGYTYIDADVANTNYAFAGSFNINGSSTWIYGLMPEDGSKTGTYAVDTQPFTYSSSSLSMSSFSPVTLSDGFSSATRTASFFSYTGTLSTSSYPFKVTL